MPEPLWIERLDMLPADARPHIRRYVEHGHGASLAGFYRAVMSNDLIGAVVQADADNRAALPDFVDYLVSYAPAGCYGTPERVDSWRGTNAGDEVRPHDDSSGREGADPAKYVKLMADYSSDGVWASSGAMMDRDSLPIGQDLKDAIERWCLDYEKSQFYLSPDDRTVDFDVTSFNARGEELAKQLSRELPGWTVVHFPE